VVKLIAVGQRKNHLKPKTEDLQNRRGKKYG
jgi:hypothetical protein